MSSDISGRSPVERVSVIIPNWNGSRWLGPCLDSLRLQTYTESKTYLVDNGSTDDSVTFVRGRFPEVAVISLPENRGFSAAVNAGIRASRGEYVVALNNDTEVHPTWLENLVTAMHTRPDVGFCASKILDFTDRTKVDSIGDGYSRAGISFKIGAGMQDNERSGEPHDVFGACAAAAMYRRSMLEDIGLFDEDFFAYMEDVDLSIRARLAGYGCIAVPAAIVYHIGSATSGGSASAFSVRLTARNIVNVLVKNIPASLLPGMLLRTAVLQAAVLGEAVLTNRRKWLRSNLGAYFAGLAAAARDLPLMLAKRKTVRSITRISAREFSELMAAAAVQGRSFGQRERDPLRAPTGSNPDS